MRSPTDWEEEHWDVVAMAAAVTCALTLGAAIALTFNVVAAQLEERHAGTAGVASAPVSNARPVIDDVSLPPS